MAPVVIGLPQASVVRTPDVTDSSWPLTDEDWHMITLVASLQEELADLPQRIDTQKCSAAHAEDNNGEDEDMHTAAKHHL